MARQAEVLKTGMALAAIPGTSLEVSRVAIGTWAIGGWMWGGTDAARCGSQGGDRPHPERNDQ